MLSAQSGRSVFNFYRKMNKAGMFPVPISSFTEQEGSVSKDA